MSNPGFFQKLKQALGIGTAPPSSPAPRSSATVQQDQVSAPAPQDSPAQSKTVSQTVDNRQFARQCLKLVGGKNNVVQIDACVTRVRLTLKETQSISDDRLKAIGAAAVVRVGDKNLQIVVGPQAEAIAGEMKKVPVTDDLSNVEVPA